MSATMRTVVVCVGSSCHLKGARDVVERFSELLKEEGLEGQVELKGSFCMERCGEGVNWRIDERELSSRTVEEAVSVFRQHVLNERRAGVSEAENRTTRQD